MLFFIDKLNLFMRFVMAGTCFLLAVTGILLFLHKWLKQSGHIRFLYVLMLFSGVGAMAVFLAGVVCICLPFNIFLNRWTFFVTGWTAASGAVRVPFFLTAAGFWAAGLLWKGYKSWKEQKSLQYLFQMNQPVTDPQIRTCFQNVADETGIRNVPLLFSNAAVEVPFLKGIRHAVIIIPEKPLSLQEQVLAFAHELSHCKRHDLFYRYFLRMVFWLYWFFPLNELYMDIFVELQETLCDIDVCRRCRSYFNATTYYTTILSITSRRWNLTEIKNSLPVSSLSEHESQLRRRIGNMSGYQNGTRRKGIVMVVTLLCCVLFLGDLLIGMYWPDFLIGHEDVVKQIEIDEGISEIFLSGSEMGSPQILEEKSREKEGTELKWDRLTSYRLKPGEQISSEPFQGTEGEILVLMIAASEAGYEVRLVNRKETVFLSRMDDTASLNLKMEDVEYRLFIRNSGTNELQMELFCTR